MKVQLKKCTLDLNSLLLFNNKLNNIKVYLINVQYIYILPITSPLFIFSTHYSFLVRKKNRSFRTRETFYLKRRINRRPLFPINDFMCFLQCPPLLLIPISSPFDFSLLQHSFKFHSVP